MTPRIPWVLGPRATAAFLFGIAMLLSTPADAARTIRLATVAPRNSTWGKLLATWERVVQKKTNGELVLKVYYNAVQGDEPAMVAKMRTGQLDAAALSSVGLSHIYRDVMVLQLPGVTNSWPLSDVVRTMLREPMDRGFRAAGFELLDWGDIGVVHQMSRGVAVRRPTDLRGRRPMVWRNEPMGPLIYSLIGQVVPVPLGTVDVLPALRAGTIDIIAAPALAAEQLQWTPFLDHISEQVIVCALGASVLKKDVHDSIAADTREMFRDIQRRVARAQSAQIRRLDREAVTRLRAKMKVVQVSDDDKVEWYRIFLKAVRRMRYGIFTRELVDRVLEITGKG